MCIQNPVKGLRWSALEKEIQLLTIFAKSLILNLLEFFEYVSGFKNDRAQNIRKFSLI